MDRDNKHIETLVDKMMTNTSLEAPSQDFTKAVMAQVKAMAQNQVTAYKPLISKPVWFALFALIAGVVAYSMFNSSSESSWLSSVNLNVLANNSISEAFSSLKLSKTVAYAVGMFALMFTVQIPLLKGYFNRRLHY